MKGAIERLRAEIASDRNALREQLRELEELALGGDNPAGDRARAAVALHHAYSAGESIMLRVARQLEGGAPEGPDWHQALLESMGLELEGIREPVFTAAPLSALRQLLGFRHFFRHAYAVALDGDRLAELRQIVLDAEATLLADLDRLDEFLRNLSNAAVD